MHHRINLVGLVLFLGAAAGCIPTVSTYFSPLAPGAQLLDARCPREKGAVARLAQEGIFLSLRAGEESGGRLLIQFSFEVPDGRVVEFKDETAYLQSGVDSLPFKIEADSGPYVYVPMEGASIPKEEIKARGWATLHDPLPGSEGDRLGVAKTDSKVYGFKIRALAKTGEQFSVLLPRYAVNGVIVPAVKVDFRRTEFFVLASLNC